MLPMKMAKSDQMYSQMLPNLWEILTRSMCKMKLGLANIFFMVDIPNCSLMLPAVYELFLHIDDRQTD